MQYQNGQLEDLGAILGTEAALRLCAIHGGGSLYVPDSPSKEHPLTRLLGEIPFRRLCQEFGSQIITPPELEAFQRLRRVRQVSAGLSRGLRVRELAVILALSERQIANYRSQAEDLGILPTIFCSKVGAAAQLPLREECGAGND